MVGSLPGIKACRIVLERQFPVKKSFSFFSCVALMHCLSCDLVGYKSVYHQDYFRESNEFANAWILVAFCFDRWTRLSSPLVFHGESRGRQRRKALKIIVAIFIFAFFINLPRFFEFEFAKAEDICVNGDNKFVNGCC